MASAACRVRGHQEASRLARRHGRSPSDTWTVRFNPATRVTYRYIIGCIRTGHATLTGDASYIEFQSEPGETMRINSETLTYSLTRYSGAFAERVTTGGFCRQLP
jgi:hypothetical protein